MGKAILDIQILNIFQGGMHHPNPPYSPPVRDLISPCVGELLVPPLVLFTCIYRYLHASMDSFNDRAYMYAYLNTSKVLTFFITS